MNQNPNLSACGHAQADDLIPITANCFLPAAQQAGGKTYQICLTTALYEEWKKYPTCLALLIHHGMRLLQRPSDADEIHIKERVVVRNRVSVIEDWEGRIIFLQPHEMEVFDVLTQNPRGFNPETLSTERENRQTHDTDC